MISLTAEHALRAVLHLASQTGASCTVDTIAKHTGVPAGSLAKVLQQLSRAGLVTSQRGPNGGFMLTHSPADISFMDVIAAVDPHVADRYPAVPSDPLTRRLKETRARAEATYRDTTVAGFLSEQEPSDEVLVTKGE